MNNKKKVTLLASLSLVGVLAVGGTLALFQATTDTKSNVFTAGTGVSAELKEPAWDGICFTTEDCPKTNLGKDTAKDFAPADVIAKDPTIKNTSSKEAVYAGFTITYTGQTLAEIQKFADIDFNKTDWDFSTDMTKAYYKKPVAKDGKTSPVFTKVTIKKDVKADAIKGFEIAVKGFVVQAEGADAKTTLGETFTELR